MKHKSEISIFIISAFVALGVFTSFFSATHTAYACYCYPNLAVYPNGNDPHCINHVGDASYCGANSISGNSSSVNSINPVNGSGAASSFSCTPSAVKDFKSLIENLVIGCFYTSVIDILIALSVIFFLYGIFKFVRTENETERASGKQFMLWGIIGLFVMLSVMGIVSILKSSLGNSLSNNQTINQPK